MKKIKRLGNITHITLSKKIEAIKDNQSLAEVTTSLNDVVKKSTTFYLF